MQNGQNDLFLGMDIESCAGSAIIFDGSTGGHIFQMLENEMPVVPLALDTFITMQSYAVTAGEYTVPSTITINQAIFDNTPHREPWSIDACCRKQLQV